MKNRKGINMSMDKKDEYLAGYTYDEWEKLEQEFLIGIRSL